MRYVALFMNYVMKEYTNLRYMSRWAGVLLQRLNEIYIDNTPGTHSDMCNIKTVPVILNALGGESCAFPPASFSPHLSSAIGYEVIINISHVSHGYETRFEPFIYKSHMCKSLPIPITVIW